MTTSSRDELLQVLKKGEAIVIAGTGVSASVAYSNTLIRSWPLLLRHGVDFCCTHCHDHNEVSEACRLFDATKNASLNELLTIGDEIQEYLIKNSLMEAWLETVFAGLSPEDQRLIRALEKLHIPIATTNYDRLFEDITGLPGISWRDTAKLHRFLNGQEQAILHLHGHFRDPSSIILGKRSYETLLEEEFAQFAEQSLFSRYNVVFVGFGDSTKDPNFSRLLTWSRKYLSATQVFRIVRESEVDNLRQEHQKLGYKIQTVSYGSNYGDLAPFLEGLAYQLPKPLPIPKSLPALPDNVGRGDIIEKIVELVVGASTKPVALLGGAGIGKSNTVLNVLYHRKTAIQFGERRYFIRCNGITSPDILWRQILDTIGLQPSRDLELQQQVESFFAEEPALLVFDNAETLWENLSASTATIFGRLKALPNLRMVITYRGKSVPGTQLGWLPIVIHPLTATQAKELFLNLTGDEFATDEALSRLLRAVDYLPLAVTLLAERAKDEQRLSSLEQKWEKRKTDLLKLEDANKELNLEVSILLSFDSPRLNDNARELFKALCWLPDGILRNVWEDAFPDNEDDQISLLRVALAEEDTSGRVRVLAPIRDVINRKFTPTTSFLEIVVRKIVENAAGNGQRVSSQEGAYHQIQAEWLTLNHIFASYPYSDWLIDGLTDLTLFSLFSGQYLVDFLHTATRQAESNQWQGLQANCLYSLGEIAFRQSDSIAALHYYQQAQPLYEQIGSILGQAGCLKSLGDIAFRQSDNDSALHYYQQAQPLYVQVGSILGQASCLTSLGNVAFRQSDNDSALQYYQQAQPLYEQIGSILGQASCLTSLGNVAFRQSDNSSALEYYQRAKLLYEQLQDVLGQANCLRSLGDVAFRQSDNDSALDFYLQAELLYQQVGSALGQANCLNSLGDVAFRQFDNDSALQYYQQAKLLYEKLQDVLGQANCLYSLGEIAFRQLDNDSALHYNQQAQLLYQQVGSTLGEAGCLKSLGDIAFRQSDSVVALHYYQQAQPLYQHMGDMVGQAGCLKSLGDIAFYQSDNESGNRLYSEAIELYHKINDRYSIGFTYYYWAEQATDKLIRQERYCQAKKAWEAARLHNLVEQYNLTDIC
ncbi:hypothetical protein GCM10028807_03710 [Spirosoma daeguense]